MPLNLAGAAPRHGGGAETVHQGAAVVRDLGLDSVHGYIYWSSDYRLESALMNGDSHQMIFQLPLFTGRYIFGLALDLNGGALYWLVKDADKLTVFRAMLRSGPRSNPSHTVEQMVQFTASAQYRSATSHSSICTFK